MRDCKTKICFYKIILAAQMIRDWRKIIRDTRRPVEMGRKKKRKKEMQAICYLGKKLTGEFDGIQSLRCAD